MTPAHPLTSLGHRQGNSSVGADWPRPPQGGTGGRVDSRPGPWGHLLPYDLPSSRGTGEIDFGPNALIDLNETLLRWFDYWLEDRANGIVDEPPVTVFTLGENRWQHLSDWPPPAMRQVRYYLHAEGGANSLSGDGSLQSVPPSAQPADTYEYDPDDPVPSLGGNNLTIDIGVQDQRSVEERNDVLVYTSEPLEKPLEITGPVSVCLWAASSAVDTDFTAKLIECAPRGLRAKPARRDHPRALPRLGERARPDGARCALSVHHRPLGHEQCLSNRAPDPARDQLE